MAVNFGIIGVGGFAFNRSIPAFLQSDYVNLVAIMDSEPQNLTQAAKKFNVPVENCYNRVDDLLSHEEMQAVVVSTPVHTHFELVKAAVDRGKHVFSEKPLGRTTVEAEKLVYAAYAMKVKLGVGFHLRFHVLHQKARDLIQEGAFGNVNLIRMQNHMNYPPIPGAWRQNPEISGGGGPSMDVGSHHLDLMCYLVDSKITEITAITANQVHEYDVEDIAVIVIKFASGTIGMMDLSWNTPNRFNMFEVYGSDATLYCERTVGPFKQPYGRLLKGDAIEEIKPAYQDTYTLEIESFARWIEHDEPCPVSGAEGLRNNRLLEKVNEAVAQKRTILTEI